MFDEPTRHIKNTLLLTIAPPFRILTPTQLSLLGLLMVLPLLWSLIAQAYLPAFLFWTLNRVFDGLDGIVARTTDRSSDLGGYIDILCDYVAYAALPIGLVAGAPTSERWLALAFLLATFYVNSASWIYLSALLEKRNRGAQARGETTSITMPVGVVGGFVTIVFYCLFLLLPAQMTPLFVLMGVLTLAGIVQRLLWAGRNLS